MDVTQSVEVPISVRFTTKRNFFFNFRLSSSRYKIQFDGNLYRGHKYLGDTYGDFQDFLNKYEGDYDNTDINLDRAFSSDR